MFYFTGKIIAHIELHDYIESVFFCFVNYDLHVKPSVLQRFLRHEATGTFLRMFTSMPFFDSSSLSVLLSQPAADIRWHCGHFSVCQALQWQSCVDQLLGLKMSKWGEHDEEDC